MCVSKFPSKFLPGGSGGAIDDLGQSIQGSGRSVSLAEIQPLVRIPADLNRALKRHAETNLDIANRSAHPGVAHLGTEVSVAMVAELIGSNMGVGFQLLNAQAVFDMAGAIAWTLSLVALLSLFQGMINFMEGRLLGWRPKGEQA